MVGHTRWVEVSTRPRVDQRPRPAVGRTAELDVFTVMTGVAVQESAYGPARWGPPLLSEAALEKTYVGIGELVGFSATRVVAVGAGISNTARDGYSSVARR
jgi:hypothetical protein